MLIQSLWQHTVQHRLLRVWKFSNGVVSLSKWNTRSSSKSKQHHHTLTCNGSRKEKGEKREEHCIPFWKCIAVFCSTVKLFLQRRKKSWVLGSAFGIDFSQLLFSFLSLFFPFIYKVYVQFLVYSLSHSPVCMYGLYCFDVIFFFLLLVNLGPRGL